MGILTMEELELFHLLDSIDIPRYLLLWDKDENKDEDKVEDEDEEFERRREWGYCSNENTLFDFILNGMNIKPGSP